MTEIRIHVPTVVEQVEQIEGVDGAAGSILDDQNDVPIGITLSLTEEVAENPDYLPDEIEALLPDGCGVDVREWPNPDDPLALEVGINVPRVIIEGGGFFDPLEDRGAVPHGQEIAP